MLKSLAWRTNAALRGKFRLWHVGNLAGKRHRLRRDHHFNFLWNVDLELNDNIRGPCTGTFAASGSAGGTTLNWTSPAVTGNCSNLPTGITIAVQAR